MTTPTLAGLLAIAASVSGFNGLTIPRKSDAPKHERPPGADERDLREAEEKRRRRAERRMGEERKRP